MNTATNPATAAINSDRTLEERQKDVEAVALAHNAGRKPVFGDLMLAPWASESNPQREGYFVRAERKTGHMNPGLWYEMTDRNGKFWTTNGKTAMFVTEPARATQASAEPSIQMPTGLGREEKRAFIIAHAVPSSALSTAPTCQCDACKAVVHDSDCAVHNMPAATNRACDCGKAPSSAPSTDLSISAQKIDASAERVDSVSAPSTEPVELTPEATNKLTTALAKYPPESRDWEIFNPAPANAEAVLTDSDIREIYAAEIGLLAGSDMIQFARAILERCVVTPERAPSIDSAGEAKDAARWKFLRQRFDDCAAQLLFSPRDTDEAENWVQVHQNLMQGAALDEAIDAAMQPQGAGGDDGQG